MITHPKYNTQELLDEALYLLDQSNKLLTEINDLVSKVTNLALANEQGNLNVQNCINNIQNEIQIKIQQVENNINELSKIFASTEDATRTKIAEAAASVAGSLYKEGGRKPGGIDCSGTVYYTYRAAGINIPNLTAQGYHNIMTHINREDLKPGDIITYWNPTPNDWGDHITHVQVYIGVGI